jgi:hypothetical protein
MIVSSGEVAEWLKAVDSKSTVGFVYRGFESPSLLHFHSFFIGEVTEWLKVHDWKSCVG